jgi:hypothetical protein
MIMTDKISNACMSGNPSGLHRSVENASPIYVHPAGDASQDGMQRVLWDGFSTERSIPTGCNDIEHLHVIYFVSLNKTYIK